MQVEIKIDPSCSVPRAVIWTDSITEEVSRAAERLSGEASVGMIAGFQGERAALLAQDNLIRIYGANGKIFAATEEGEYRLRLRLYELEERLDRRVFVRISNSEIISLKKVKGFDLNLSGTIRVSLSDGSAAYVSRRYVKRIRQVLGL